MTRTNLTRAVTALAAAGTLGSLALTGSTASAASTSKPPAPTSLTVVTSAVGPYLKWKGGATEFVVQQASDMGFKTNVQTYTLRAPTHEFTPYRVSNGTAYYFRVRAKNSSGLSGPSNVVGMAETAHYSPLKIAAYNVLAANQAGASRAGGTVAPWSDRRPGVLSLIRKIGGAIVGIEEGANCLHKRQGQPCYRQIDDVAAGLSTHYKLAHTWGAGGKSDPTYYSDVNILFNPNVVSTAATGGTWEVGPGSDVRFAAYQTFTVNATGAKFLVVDIHTLAPPGSAEDKIRGEETQNMLDNAKRYAGNHNLKSILYIGDFNAYYGQYQVNDASGRAMNNAGIPDGIAVAQSHPMGRFDSNNRLYRHARKGHGSIDHIYATGGIAVKTWGELLNLNSSGDFIGTIPSDHNPIYANILLPY